MEKTAHQGYSFQTVARQAIIPLGDSVAGYYAARGYYQSFTALSNEAAFQNVFNGWWKSLYAENTFGKRVLGSLFLNKEHRQNLVSIQQREELKLSAAGNEIVAHRISRVVGIGWLAMDIAGLSLCFGTGCDPVEYAAIASDSGRVAFDLYAIGKYLAGMRNYENANFAEAFKKLFLTQQVMIKLGGFQMVAGIARFVIAAERYISTGESRGSEFVYGGIDALSGTAQVVKSKFLLDSSRAAVQAALTSGGDIAAAQSSASDILAFKAVKYTPRVAGVIRFAGVAGASVGVVTNAYTLYDSLTDPDMPLRQQEKNVISSYMGIVGGGMLVASAVIVAPAAAPVAIGLAIGGIAVIAASAIYEYFWE